MNPYVQEFLGKYQEKINRRENHKVLMEMRDVRIFVFIGGDDGDNLIFMEFHFFLKRQTPVIF